VGISMSWRTGEEESRACDWSSETSRFGNVLSCLWDLIRQWVNTDLNGRRLLGILARYRAHALLSLVPRSWFRIPNVRTMRWFQPVNVHDHFPVVLPIISYLNSDIFAVI